ncbi:MAG: hypothetical protein AB7L91_18785 [Dehalococcoidia bacterium]
MTPTEALAELRREWQVTEDPAQRWEITQLGRAVLLIEEVFRPTGDPVAGTDEGRPS